MSAGCPCNLNNLNLSSLHTFIMTLSGLSEEAKYIFVVFFSSYMSMPLIYLMNAKLNSMIPSWVGFLVIQFELSHKKTKNFGTDLL